MIFMKAGMFLSAQFASKCIKHLLTLKCKVDADLSGQTCRARVRHKSTPGYTTLNKDQQRQEGLSR